MEPLETALLYVACAIAVNSRILTEPWLRLSSKWAALHG